MVFFAKSSLSAGNDVHLELIEASACRLPPRGEDAPDELGIVLGPVPSEPRPVLPIPPLLVRPIGKLGGSGGAGAG